MDDYSDYRGIVSGQRHRSHEDVTLNAQRIAGGLQRSGVTVGDCVCVLMRNDIAFLEASYGAAQLGAYVVPVNSHLGPDEVAYILNDSGAAVLIGHSDLLHRLAEVVQPSLKVISVPTPAEIVEAYRLDPLLLGAPSFAIDFDDWLHDQAPLELAAERAPQSMVYTSGTTGAPKGVRRMAPTPEQAAALAVSRANFGVKPGVRMLLPGPLYHSAPNSFALSAGRHGGVVVMMPRFDAEEMLKIIASYRIDTIFMVPTMFIRLLGLPEDVRKRYDVSSLKTVVHAAAPCPVSVKNEMMAWWGPVIYEFYGSTEAGAVTLSGPDDWNARPGTVGKALTGVHIRILDEGGQILPAGHVGEIYTKVDGAPDFTYHNKPEKRLQADRDGFVTSGDVGYIDNDGYLFISDRKSDMVISGGVNIYPAEIEAVLQDLPGVRDCAVFGVPDEEFGESLMAMVEPEAGVALDTGALRKQLRGLLAGYKVPKVVEIRHDLPREDSGKIFKRKLRDPYWAAANRSI
ncbi:long-chain fatty acid--CoA ligase [Sphingomonas panacis]|uniref:Long-chain fatty acid--CoA ligase n=1 Tax=Sphingomonas panacis TaxID=1560345 RepID=A0A1B3Z768_9SPHN|nr:acyl-CoA synthetase [Sphingomonas panacis]AOH83279.1 long-chain fatty acid--CoA ligase [Sphingomonas panacis]